jgi:WD40 repeat protein
MSTSSVYRAGGQGQVRAWDSIAVIVHSRTLGLVGRDEYISSVSWNPDQASYSLKDNRGVTLAVLYQSATNGDLVVRPGDAK